MNWIMAFLIVVPLFAFFISIPSFSSMYKIGFKYYFKQLSLLRIMLKKLSLSYKITKPQTYTYTYGNSQISKSTVIETNYFFPIFINKDRLLVISKKEGKFNTLYIQDCTQKDSEWISNSIEIKTSTCLLTQILNDKLQRKVDNLMKESIQLEDVENLNELLNSEITSIKREDKLKALLDG